MIAASADQEVGVGQVGLIEEIGEIRLGKTLGRTRPGKNFVDGIDDFSASSVADGESQGQRAVVFCLFDGVEDAISSAEGDVVNPADHLYFDVVLVEFV